MGLQEFLENYWNAHEESKGDAGHTSRAGCPCPTHECTRLAGEQRNAGAGLLSRRLLWTREVPGPFLGSRISFAASCKLSLRSESMTASISSASACAEAERSGSRRGSGATETRLPRAAASMRSWPPVCTQPTTLSSLPTASLYGFPSGGSFVKARFQEWTT